MELMGEISGIEVYDSVRKREINICNKVSKEVKRLLYDSVRLHDL